MLDSQIVSYLDAGREARGLALRLERLSRGERRARDLTIIRETAQGLRLIAEGGSQTGEKETPSVAFATTEGLGVVLHAAEKGVDYVATQDPLIAIAKMLETMVNEMEKPEGESPALSKEARTFRDFFNHVHGMCHEMIALDLHTASPTSFELAMSSSGQS